MMTQTSQDRLKDFNWALSEFDRAIEVTLSNLITLKEELHGENTEKERIASNFHDILNFKIETVYSLLVKLEELIFDTTFAFYKKYHGSIRGEVSLVEFENVKREVSYIFDSFLTQYKSLLDLAVKFAFLFSFAGQELSWKIDSFGQLLAVVDKRDEPKYKERYEILEKSGVFQNFLKNRGILEDITIYRDYIIHHGYVKHQLAAKSTEGHVVFTYLIPRLIKTGKTSYRVDPDTTLRLDYLCREKLYLLLSSIADLTDLIYGDNFKQANIGKLKTFAPELVKDILLRISRKNVWADKVLPEEELKVFLRSKDIDFSELIEDFVSTQREPEERTKSGESIGMLVERIHYKPIGNIRVFRTRFIHEKNSKTRQDIGKPMFGVMIAGVGLSDFISQKPEYEGVLDTLRKSGLAYVIKAREGTRYASVRDYLKSLVVALDELSRFKYGHLSKFLRWNTLDRGLLKRLRSLARYWGAVQTNISGRKTKKEREF